MSGGKHENVLADLTPLVKHDPLTTAGLRAYSEVRDKTPRPPILGVDEYWALASAERRRYDLRRLFSNANIDLIDTPMLEAVSGAALNRIWPNAMKRAPGPVDGIFINGGGQQGKSSIALHIASTFLLEWLDAVGHENPTPYVGGRDAHEPVVFIEVPSTPNLKMTCGAILDALGEEWDENDRLGILRARVVKLLKGVGCRLLILDEITRLKMGRQDDQQVLDMVREFMQTGATIVGVGVGITSSGLLNEGRYEDKLASLTPGLGHRSNRMRKKAVEDDDQYTQTERRFQVLHVTNFSYADAKSRADWVAFLEQLGSQLRLVGMDPDRPGRILTDGDLPEYIFRRTGGVVGTVHELVTGAAWILVDEGRSERTEELITVELLGRVHLNASAEAGRTDLETVQVDSPDPRSAAAATQPRKKGASTVLRERASGQ